MNARRLTFTIVAESSVPLSDLKRAKVIELYPRDIHAPLIDSLEVLHLTVENVTPAEARV